MVNSHCKIQDNLYLQWLHQTKTNHHYLLILTNYYFGGTGFTEVKVWYQANSGLLV